MDPKSTPGRARARRVRFPVDTSKLCKELAKSTGRPCQAHPVLGYEVCQSHGGGGGGQVKHGRYWSGPARLRAAYEASLNDKSLLDLRHGLAMLDAILKLLQERMAEGDSPQYRSTLSKLWADLKATRTPDGDKSAAGQILLTMGATIERGAIEDDSLQRLFDGFERFQKRVEEARRVRIQGQQAINARDLNAALVRVLDELQRGASAEGIAGEVVERLVGRMETAVRDLGLEPGSRVTVGSASAN